MGIFISDVALLAMGSLLVYAGQTYGWKAVFMYYVIPWMVSGIWVRIDRILGTFVYTTSLPAVQSLVSFALPSERDLR